MTNNKNIKEFVEEYFDKEYENERNSLRVERCLKEWYELIYFANER